MPASSSPVASPCIGICKLDPADICIGCGRHVSEIIAWPYSTEAEQLQICERARERLAKRRPGPDAGEFPVD